MKKIIKIGDKEFTMKSSAYTQFAYKNITGRSLLSDCQELSEIDTADVSKLDPFIEMITRIAYVMVDEADSTQVNNYNDFLKSLDSLFDDISWITEVIGLAISPLSRQLQTNINTNTK